MATWNPDNLSSSQDGPGYANGLRRIDHRYVAQTVVVLAKDEDLKTTSTAQSLMIGFRICSLSRDNPDTPTHLPWKPCSEDMNDAGAKSLANTNGVAPQR